MTAVVVTVVVGLLALTRMAAGGADSERLDVIEPPATTTAGSSQLTPLPATTAVACTNQPHRLAAPTCCRKSVQ
jgi:hypothetical protein